MRIDLIIGGNNQLRNFNNWYQNKHIGRKKQICGRFHFFMLECKNFVYRGNRPWKNASLQNFSDLEPQLSALEPATTEKAILWQIYTHTQVKNRNLNIFGRWFWLTQLQSRHVRVSILKRSLSSNWAKKKLDPIIWKRSFVGRFVVSIDLKMAIYSSFCGPLSDRHRACSYKFSPTNQSSDRSI